MQFLRSFVAAALAASIFTSGGPARAGLYLLNESDFEPGLLYILGYGWNFKTGVGSTIVSEALSEQSAAPNFASGSSGGGLVVSGGGSTIIVNGVIPPYIFAPAINVSTAAPEPATWAMMIVGLAGVGWVGARRRRALAG